MKNEETVIVSGVTKKYRIGQSNYKTLREDIMSVFKRGISRDNSFFALDDISFTVGKGDSLGIIGHNGAGKSTMLKILAGVTNPTSGTVVMNGKIGALIELSAGFHPELTGRENIYLYGSIIGLKNEYINRKFDEIVEFSGLSRFIDTPIKRYSSGMFARLGFSVTAHLDPDILIIDEVLSVGDFNFQEKCINKMLEFKNKGVTIIFVSHNLESVKKLCRKTLLLDNGKALANDVTDKVIDEYYKLNSMKMKGRDEDEHLRIADIKLFNSRGESGFSFNSGEKLFFDMRFEVLRELSEAAFSLFVRLNDGVIVFDVGSAKLNKTKYDFKKGKMVNITGELKLNLLKGLYYLGLNIYGRKDDGTIGFVEYLNKLTSFRVKEELSEQGIANLEPIYRISVK